FAEMRLAGSGCSDHTDDVRHPDDAVLEPVQRQDRGDAPVPGQHPDERDDVGGDQGDDRKTRRHERIVATRLTSRRAGGPVGTASPERGRLPWSMRLPDPLSALRRHGVEARLVARLALPVVFTNLLQTLVNVVDVVMVGRLGPIEVAAVGMAQMVRMLLMVGVLSVTTGAMVLAAQARGAYDDARLSMVARQALTLAVLFGVALGTLGFFSAEPLLGFMSSGASPDAVGLGTSYLRILFLGAPLMALTFSVTQLMQGAGDTLTPLVLVGAINVLNVAFNALFIFGLGPVPAFGVDGAAYGTVVARAIGVVAGVWLLASGRNVVRLGRGSFVPHWPIVRTMVGIGVPAGTQGVLQNVSGLL